MEAATEIRANVLAIANTIKAQIMAGDYWALARMGAHRFGTLSPTNEGSLGGLQFKVNGSKVKGYVLVRLMGDDTYTVTSGKIRRNEWIPLGKVEGVYCDNLAAVIEGMVG